MQVKKFEAKSMKEALQMVKAQLGPDAVILSVHGNGKNFGLMGKGSVEVTAAASDSTLQKKRYAESRLSEKDKQKYDLISASGQKRFINKAVDQYRESQVKPPQRQFTRTQYVDIPEDSSPEARPQNKPLANRVNPTVARNVQKFVSAMDYPEVSTSQFGSSDQLQDKAIQRIHAAAAAAARQSKALGSSPLPPKEQGAGTRELKRAESEIIDLKRQISQLQGALEGYSLRPTSVIAMHPGATLGVPYELSGMFEKMISIGISEVNSVEIVRKLQDEMPLARIKSKPLVQAWVVKHLLDQIAISTDPYAGRVHQFVGPSGQGKTSMLVKFASHLVINKKRSVAIMAADSLKVGAIEQLKILSRILNVPFGIIRSAGSWKEALNALKGIDHILVDFPGMSLRSQGELQLIKQFAAPSGVVSKTHYVQSVVAKDANAIETATRYLGFGFDDVMFTCIDEACHHGLIYNFQREFNVPLHSFGIGVKMPEDFELASKERVIDLFFKLTLNEERGE